MLSGDLGNDLVTGGNGQDVFAIQLGHGSDTIADFINETDLIGLPGGLTFGDLSITGSNGNTLISSGNELLGEQRRCKHKVESRKYCGQIL